MADYEAIPDEIRTTKKVIEFMARSQFSAAKSSNQRDKFTDSHTRFNVTIEHEGKEYCTEYQCNLQYSEPTFGNVLSSLVSNAAAFEQYSDIDDFAHNAGFEKPSRAMKAWEGCEQAHEAFAAWGIKGEKLLDYSNLLNNADLESLEQVASARHAELYPAAPEIPEGWKLTTDLMDDLWTGEHGDELASYTGDIGDAINELADSNVDIYTSDLHEWIGQPNNHKWIAEAKSQGLLEGAEDFDKMIMVAQYVCNSQDLCENIDDIVRYAMLSSLKDGGVYAISPETAELLEEIDCGDTNTTFESMAQEARDIIEEHSGVMWDRGDRNYEVVPFVVSEQETDFAYDLEGALDKAEQTAKKEQGNERSSDIPQTSKDAR